MSLETDPERDDPVVHIEVAVKTPEGTWPTEGYRSVPVHQEVRRQLHDAARSLHIDDTRGWVARVDSRMLDAATSYRQNGLAGRVTIVYGPSGAS